MYLNEFSNSDFERGASKLTELIWIFVSWILTESWIPGSAWRCFILRLFGAQVGRGVVIKPRVRVKFPWRLKVGSWCWLGEGVWIDNLGAVELGDHVCLSQGVYLCTGSHNWGLRRFDLVVKPIIIRSHAWVGAMSRVSPGVTIGEGAVLGFGSVATKDILDWSINFGVPASYMKSRACTDC